MNSTPQTLQQLVIQTEREQQELLLLRAHNADLLAEKGGLQQAVDEGQEHISALRNVLRRERAEKKELEERLKREEQKREAAFREAALAKTAHTEAVREMRQAEADLAQAEWGRNAVVEEIETDAENRITHAEDKAAQSRDEIRVKAELLRCQRRRARRAESERDQLRLQKQADAEAIYNLRVELDARPRD